MDRVKRAFSIINRQDFVPASIRNLAYLDTPLKINYGQTISQPSTVESMLYWLDAQPGDRIMDVGSGSGWTTALLSIIIQPHGKVFAVEIIPELVEFGKNNCINANIKDVEFFQANKVYGLPKYAPFDRILVSASAQTLPTDLINQLKNGGKLVIPVKNDILEITKITNEDLKIIKHPGYIFVPLI